jgi:RNA polymerase sigma-70 factor (ECF subfamily)
MGSILLPPAARDSVLRELLAQVAAGNEGALVGIHRLTGDRLHRVALGVLGDWDAAEDVIADTFSQVWRRADTYDPKRGSVMTWLTTIARNRAIDRLRGGARDDAASIDDMASTMLPPDHGSTPSSVAAGSEDASKVRRAVRDLPSIQRRAIELAFFEGLSHQQVATTLGKPIGTIKTRIRAGLAAIRDGLGRKRTGE